MLARWQKPEEYDEYASEYDVPSELIQDEIQRNVSPLQTFKIDMTNAGSKFLQAPGRGFQVFTYDGSGNIITNAGISVAINDNINQETIFPSDSQGFRGSFYQLYLSWPSNGSGSTLYFIVLKSFKDPFTRFA